MATLIDGKALALENLKKIAKEVALLKSQGITPGLAFVVVGEHPPSQIYVRNKQKACEGAGIKNSMESLPSNATEKDLLKTLKQLNQNREIHGILVQLPIPKHLNTQKILMQIDPQKDVDGLHPNNLGRLLTQTPGLKPCTPQGVLAMIESVLPSLQGKEACVVGRSAIVGLSTFLLLEQKDVTVTLCHSKTKQLDEKISRADIVVSAIGRSHFIQGSWIKKGAVVIDVGINRLPNGRIVGDVDFEEAHKRASFISPVPGGVGPMTIAMLLKNTVEACKAQKERDAL